MARIREAAVRPTAGGVPNDEVAETNDLRNSEAMKMADDARTRAMADNENIKRRNEEQAYNRMVKQRVAVPPARR